ncbi:MAG TPA: hypothetical protein VN688_01105 [Gemmataceae bacterium]|nr:hypothetical protein [Gemmataceae bacterium]
MSAIMQSARGASAFTQPDYSFVCSTGAADKPFTPFLGCDEAAARTWLPLIDELLHIRNLQDDWDGEGTEAPHPALVDGAITLAQYLQANRTPPADRVLAGVNGTIYFEWHTSFAYQEIEVTSPIDAECRWVQKDSDVTEVINLSRRS